jgi:hypothetical protein
MQPNSNPTPADLAALKKRLEFKATSTWGADAADLRLAARCVAAWVKLEKSEYDLSKVDGVWYCGHYDGATALAAVEGAEVGK